MTAQDLALLEDSIDVIIEFQLLDGRRFLATPLFVYTGPENPDVFLLPVTRNADGILAAGSEGHSILLEDIEAIYRT